MTPSPRRRCAKRREYVADQKTKRPGLAAATAALTALASRHGVDDWTELKYVCVDGLG